MTPPLLRRMNESRVGELAVYNRRIIEPRTDCCVASGFPSNEAACAAAAEMNDIADWIGVIKARAEGRKPNCQAELERIAQAHGGQLGHGANADTMVRCAAAVKDL